MQVLILFLVGLIVMIIPSHFISLMLYRRLTNNGNKYAMAIRLIVFFLSLAVFAIIIFIVIANNIRFER